MVTLTGLTGGLAVARGAQTAVLPAQLTVLALAYDEHVARLARRDGPVPHCGHASDPPYIVMPGDPGRAWCARCAGDALAPAGQPCSECPMGETAVYMFPYGDVVAAAAICQDCGGDPRSP